MTLPFTMQSYQAWNNESTTMPERRTPTQGDSSYAPPSENAYSPVPGFSTTSHSSPGSTSDYRNASIPGQDYKRSPVPPSGYTLPGSRSLSTFQVQITSCPSSSSFDNASSFKRVNSTLSSSSEGHSHLMIPVSTDLHRSGPGSPQGRKDTVKPSVARRRSTSAKPRSKTSAGVPGEESTTQRRQKRLQRNRESARLSRRRRKVYLEVLEDRVNHLSEELDKCRREHVSEAVECVQRKRAELLNKFESSGDHGGMSRFGNALSRTSEEMMVCTSFQTEQLKSFFVPPSLKFVLWLTLQSDSYFRGGRAASERLSAARIGERMLSSGTDRAAPVQQMWPLLCNEIGLSYDQEEKVRSFQKGVLQDNEAWVDRHRVYASGKVMTVAHDCIQALTLRSGQREKATHGTLSSDQRNKLFAWASRNKSRISHCSTQKNKTTTPKDEFVVSKEQHVASNLYILNHRLENVLKQIPRAAPIVTGASLRKLSVRPCFESLGAQDEKCPDAPMSREDSFGSLGSLNRNETEMASEDDDDKVPTQITPQEAQEIAQPFIDSALNHVRSIIPPPPLEYIPPPLNYLCSMPLPPSHPNVTSSFAHANSINYASAQCSVLPAQVSMNSMEHNSLPNYQHGENNHQRKSSFIPAGLNVVPEEMWPDDTDEFLMDLVDGDWAIGEGIDMDQIE